MAIENLDVRLLRLDPENPRLPESLFGASQGELLKHLWDTGALDELATSFVANRYFPHEPLVVLRPAGHPPDQPMLVLEGNRRLATLKILLQLDPAPELGLQFDLDSPLPAEVAADLLVVPAYPILHRSEVRKFLGFRHIGGIKTWSPEAKARYLLQEIEAAVVEGSTRPFLAVARRVGSNTQTVRGSFLALGLLRFARDELRMDVNFVQYQRFGVWLRCMSSASIRSYLKLTSATTYEEVRESISAVDRDHLAEVLSDLKPQAGREDAVLYDSRDVSIYGRIIEDGEAHDALRKYGDIDVAAQVVARADFPLRVRRAAAMVEALIGAAPEANFTADLFDASDSLNKLSRTLHSIVEGMRRDAE